MFEYVGSRELPPGHNGAGPARAGPGGPEESIIDVAAIVSSLRRFWWIPALTTLAGFGIGWLLVSRDVPMYRASATIRLVDPRTSYTDIIGQGVVTADPVASQLVVLQGRAYLGEVVDAARLRVFADSPAVAGGDTGLLVDAPESAAFGMRIARQVDAVRVRIGQTEAGGSYGEPITIGDVQVTVDGPEVPGVGTYYVVGRDEAIDWLSSSFRTSPRSNTDAIDIAHTSDDPALSLRVVNTAVIVFQNVNAESMRQSAVRRRTFVGEQLRRADSMLIAAQAALGDFRRERAVYSSGTRMQERQSELASVERQRQSLEADRTIYEVLLERLEASRSGQVGPEIQAIMVSPAIAANPLVTTISNQLQFAIAARDSLLNVEALQPIHPAVLQVDTVTRVLHTRLKDAVRGHVESLRIRIDAVTAQRQRVLADLRALPEAEAEETRLIEEVEAARAATTELRSELQRARIAEAVEAGQVEIVSLAATAVPMGSPVLLRFLLASMAGLMLGGALALLLDQANRSIRGRDEMEASLRLRKLAVIPRVAMSPSGIAPAREVLRIEAGPSAESNGAHPEVSPRWSGATNGNRWRPGYAPDSAAAEAFRTLRTNLLFSHESRTMHTLVVSSATPGEGKTTVAVNLAIAFAQLGMRVLLVDADLRQPRVHVMLGLDAEPGLTSVFAAQRNAAGLIQKTQIESLDVLPCGPPIENPAEMLSGDRMVNTLQLLGRVYDRVVIDTPPVLGASETSALAARADGTVLVVRAGQTDREAAREAVTQLANVGATVVGGVLNDPREIIAHYGSQAYRYYAER